MTPRGKPLAGMRTGFLVLFLVLFAGSSLSDISLLQFDGSTLKLESPVKRVITLAPGLAEMMFDAGSGENLVATVEYSNFPEQAARLPRIGDAFRFDLEQIIALQPDMVIAWNSGNPDAALIRLEELGLRVWRTELRQPPDIAFFLRNVALATGHAAAGEKAAVAIEQRLTALSVKYKGKPKVSYFYQVAERPLFTLNGKHIVSQGLALCGGQNVFADEPVLAPQISRESVLLADPDVLLAPHLPQDPDPLGHWRNWPRLKAVQNGALYYLSADKISRATPRMLDSLEFACTLLDQNRSLTQNSPEHS